MSRYSFFDFPEFPSNVVGAADGQRRWPVATNTQVPPLKSFEWIPIEIQHRTCHRPEISFIRFDSNLVILFCKIEINSQGVCTKLIGIWCCLIKTDSNETDTIPVPFRSNGHVMPFRMGSPFEPRYLLLITIGCYHIRFWTIRTVSGYRSPITDLVHRKWNS